jgi:hypothetical protein
MSKTPMNINTTNDYEDPNSSTTLEALGLEVDPVTGN